MLGNVPFLYCPAIKKVSVDVSFVLNSMNLSL